MSDNLNIRITIPALGISKVMLFPSNVPVSDVLAQIHSKIPNPGNVNINGDDYGLYKQDPDDEKMGFWLNKHATLNSYSIKQGDQLEVKELYRLLKFRMLDNTTKTVQINEPHPVSEIFKLICSRAGVLNVDEYSLAVEDVQTEDFSGGSLAKKEPTAQASAAKKAQSTPLTSGPTSLAMRKLEEREQKKLDKLKQRLHTDDEIRWVNHELPLCEQGINQSHILVLRRKYFYESNLNVLDPFETNILYNQCRDSILEGTLNCTFEEACDLAVLQIQVQHGSYDEAAYKGVIDIKNFIPKNFHGNLKKAEKLIKEKHQMLAGVDQTVSKQRYTTLCQSLKTYGITIFLVKEKMAGKQKLGPILLGITKESVMRMDEKTKEILQSWPLTYVRRWAASSNSFTLDFGDYDVMYSVMTRESEQISKLIAGYIDLILRKKRGQTAGNISSGVALIEENIQPGQGVLIQGQSQGPYGNKQHIGGYAQMSERFGITAESNVIGERVGVSDQIGGGSFMSNVGDARYQKLSPAQRACATRIERTRNGIKLDVEYSQLSSISLIPVDTLAINQDQQRLVYTNFITTNMAGFCASIAALSSLVNDQRNMDYGAISASMLESKVCLLELAKALKAYEGGCKKGDAEKMSEQIESLIECYKKLLGSIIINPDESSFSIDEATFGEGYNGITKCCQAIAGVAMICANVEELTKKNAVLLKALSQSSTNCISEAKAVGSKIKSIEIAEDVNKECREIALATKNIASSLDIMCATFNSSVTSKHISTLCTDLNRRLVALLVMCEGSRDSLDLTKLKNSIDLLKKSIGDICKVFEEPKVVCSGKGDIADLLSSIMQSLNDMNHPTDDMNDLILQSKVFASSLGKLLVVLKEDMSNADDSFVKGNIFKAAKQLADATKLLLDNTKLAKNEDMDADSYSESQRKVAEDIQNFLVGNYGTEVRQVSLSRLKRCAAESIETSILVASAMKTTSQSCRSEKICNSLINTSEDLNRAANLLTAAKSSLEENPDSPYWQQEFVEKADKFFALCVSVGDLCKNSTPLISEIEASTLLCKRVRSLEANCDEANVVLPLLRNVSSATRIILAKERIAIALNNCQKLNENFQKKKLVKESADMKATYTAELVAVSKEIADHHSKLLEDDTYSTDAAVAGSIDEISRLMLRLLEQCSGVVCCSIASKGDEGNAKLLIDALIRLTSSSQLCADGASAYCSSNSLECMAELQNSVKTNSQLLLDLVSSLPSQKELENISSRVDKLISEFGSDKPPLPLKPGQSYSEIQGNFIRDIQQLIELIKDALANATAEDKPKLINNMVMFTRALESSVATYGSIYAVESNMKNKVELNVKMLKVMQGSNRLVAGTKLLSNDPSSASLKNLLASATRDISNSLSDLMATLTMAKPGQKECDESANIIQMSCKNMLENSRFSVFENKTYMECVGDIDKLGRSLVTCGDDLTTNIPKGQFDAGVAKLISMFEEMISSITKNVSHATYLVAMSDESSEPSKVVVNQTELDDSARRVLRVCDTICLYSSTVDNSYLVEASKYCKNEAKVIENYCGEGLARLPEKSDFRKKLTGISKNVVDSIDKLSLDLEKFSGSMTPGWELDIGKQAEVLANLFQTLTNCCVSSGIAPLPAKVSAKGKELQTPIVGSGLLFLGSSSVVLNSIKSLINDIKNPDFVDAAKSSLAQNTSNMNKLIEVLKSNAPGEHELGAAIHQINHNHAEIGRIVELVFSGGFEIGISNLKELEAQTDVVCRTIEESLAELENNKTNQIYHRGRKVGLIANLMDSLVLNAAGIISSSANVDRNSQNSVFEALRGLNRAFFDLANSSRFRLGDQNAFLTEYEGCLRKSTVEFNEFVNRIKVVLQRSSSLNRVAETVSRNKIALVSCVLSNVSVQNMMPESQKEKEFVRLLKSVSKNAKELTQQSNKDRSAIVALSEDIGNCYCSMVELFSTRPGNGKIFAQSKESKLLVETGKLGDIVKGFIEQTIEMDSGLNAAETKKKVAKQLLCLSSQVSEILKILQSYHTGTQECNKLKEAIDDFVIDVDNCILFAENMSLTPDDSALAFSSYKTYVLQASGQLKRELVAIAKERSVTQEFLTEAIPKVGKNLQELMSNSKLGASSLGSHESSSQVSLLNSVKEVGACMLDLLDGLMPESGEPQQAGIKKAVEAAVASTEKHEKLVESIDSAMSGGSSSLMEAINKISSLLSYIDIDAPCPWDKDLAVQKPEELVRLSKDITLCTAKLVSACNASKPKDGEESVRVAVNSFCTFTMGIRSCIISYPKDRVLQEFVAISRSCIEAYLQLLTLAKNSSWGREKADKSALSAQSKKVTEAIVAFVKKCSDLKGTDLVDPNDPNVIAERELLYAASAIEAAAKKLSELKPRVVPSNAEINKELNFEGQILEAANAIMKATSLLVAAATSAQRELVRRGVVSAKTNTKDGGQWSQGLVSAARLVADSTNMLCDAAKSAVEGKASEEKLIAAANSISYSTTQLILACKVKSGANSENQERLEKAGAAVKKASKALVESMKGSGVFAEEKQEKVELESGRVGGMKQELDIMEEVLKRERELMEAREKLNKLRQAKARNKEDK